MATNTPNYNLVKQGENEFYDVNIVNANLDKIDTAIKGAKDTADSKANSNDLTTLDITVTQHLAQNDVHVTPSEKNNWNAKSNFSGNYNDLTNKPTVPTLNNTVTSTSTTQAATANAVKTAYDRAEAAFTQANDIKTKWANVVGAPLTSSDTQAQLQSKTQTIKNTLSANLTAKGQTSAGTETLTSLVDKVANITTGKKWASGTLNTDSSSVLNVRGLNFRPSIIIAISTNLLTSTSSTPTFITYLNLNLSTTTYWAYTSFAQISLVRLIDGTTILNDGFSLSARTGNENPNAQTVWYAFE